MNERIHDEPPPFARRVFPPLYRVRLWDNGPEPIHDFCTADEALARDCFAQYRRDVRLGRRRAAQLGMNGFLLERVEKGGTR